ncbi:MAG TPA: preprotein translocase subunit SecG [Nevskiaceae bacterium]|nr:preprotein translocase subunit SecG [Nevskiaceae bacterium]
MKQFILIGQIIISLLLAASILLQAKGTGLGTAFGGSGEFYRSKRGVEKIVFIATIVLAVLFLLFSIANVAIG